MTSTIPFHNQCLLTVEETQPHQIIHAYTGLLHIPYSQYILIFALLPLESRGLTNPFI